MFTISLSVTHPIVYNCLFSFHSLTLIVVRRIYIVEVRVAESKCILSYSEQRALRNNIGSMYSTRVSCESNREASDYNYESSLYNRTPIEESS